MKTKTRIGSTQDKPFNRDRCMKRKFSTKSRNLLDRILLLSLEADDFLLLFLLHIVIGRCSVRDIWLGYSVGLGVKWERIYYLTIAWLCATTTHYLIKKL